MLLLLLLLNMGPQWEWKFQNASYTPPTLNRNQRFSNLSWNLSQCSSLNCVGDFWKFEFSIFNNLFLEIFKSTIVPYGEIKKKQLSGNRAVRRGKRWEIWDSISATTYEVNGHSGVIQCTCDFSENTIPQTLLLQIAAEIFSNFSWIICLVVHTHKKNFRCVEIFKI